MVASLISCEVALLSQILLNSFTRLFVRFIPPYLNISAAIAYGPAAFSLESFLIAAVVSPSEGRCASSSISGRCAMLSIASCGMAGDRFSTSLKCSTHRSSIRLGYVSRGQSTTSMSDVFNNNESINNKYYNA